MQNNRYDKVRHVCKKIIAHDYKTTVLDIRIPPHPQPAKMGKHRRNIIDNNIIFETNPLLKLIYNRNVRLMLSKVIILSIKKGFKYDFVSINLKILNFNLYLNHLVLVFFL